MKAPKTDFRFGRIVEAKYRNGWFPVVILARAMKNGVRIYLCGYDRSDDDRAVAHEHDKGSEWRPENELRPRERSAPKRGQK